MQRPAVRGSWWSFADPQSHADVCAVTKWGQRSKYCNNFFLAKLSVKMKASEATVLQSFPAVCPLCAELC